MRSRLGPALISRMLLGTSDVFSGLFALRRAVWDSRIKHRPAHGSSLVLDSLLRRHASMYRRGRDGGRSLRGRPDRVQGRPPVKRILDARFGNYSRLVQFCIVGASGMVVDLSCYALLQLLAVAHVAGAAPIGPLRFHLAPGGRRRLVDRDRAGLELRPQPPAHL